MNGQCHVVGVVDLKGNCSHESIIDTPSPDVSFKQTVPYEYLQSIRAD